MPPNLAAPALAAGSSANDWAGHVVATESRSATDAADGADGNPANAGIRREPELPEHEDIIPWPPSPEREFDDPDVDAAKARAMRQRMRAVARQVAMDPDDGIEL